MSVFIYLAPPLTALGLHVFVRGERLVPGQWLGIALAFAGIVLAFSEGFLSERNTVLGDLCGIVGAALWAATPVVIRATRLAQSSAGRTLFYQLGVSALILPAASVLLGEPGVVNINPLVVASLAYQGARAAQRELRARRGPRRHRHHARQPATLESRHGAQALPWHLSL